MKVKNIGGIDLPPCRCGNYINHWKNFSGRRLPYYCPVIGCAEEELFPAFVQMVSSVDSGLYVIPLCKEHSQERETILEIDDYCRLISVNVNMTCELYK